MEQRNYDRSTGQSARRRPRGKKRRGGAVGKVLFVLFTLLAIGCCTAALIFGIFMKYVQTSVIPVVGVNADDYTMRLSSVVYYQDKETQEWVELRKVHGEENRIWVDLKDMPDAMWQAAVSIEDERFFQHEGVDWWRTGGAVVNMFIGMRNTFGGSTITQQLLKNMTEDNDPYVNRKVREIFRALEFEKNYTKWDILELYLNTIYFGKGCFGVQTAAEFYFGKDASELSVAECASLIAITNNPSMYGPLNNIEITMRNDDGSVKEVVTPRQLNKRRQELVLEKMASVGQDGTVEDGHTAFITVEECEQAKAQVLSFTDGTTSSEDIVGRLNSGMEVNDWFTEQVVKEVTRDLAEARGVSLAAAQTMLNNGGYQIYTTMDYDIQKIAERVYENRDNLNVTSKSGEPLQSGITIVDPYTGHVVAMVGCVGEKEGNLWTNYAVEKFQVGSSIKPLTCYAPALDAGTITPATTFDNYPVRLLNDTPWPKNSPNEYTGWTDIATGVRRSINTMALQSLESLGYPAAFAFATEKLNLSLVAEDMDASPLGMGGLTYGLSTTEMAAAFASFANSGVYTEPVMYVEVRDANGETVLLNEGESHVAMKETTAYFLNRFLTEAATSGTGASANFGGMTIAGKTGTTTDNRARYFVGYTPYYAAAVWTGYRTNEKISYSGNPAITMWKLVMKEIHAELENRSFSTPSFGLEKVTVCKDSGLLCSDACHADIRGDRAVTVEVASGTAPTETCTMHAYRNYCRDGACLATERCPASSVVQAAFLDYDRPDYFNADGTKIAAADDAYLIRNMERAIGLRPTVAADGTESYPAVTGCPVHTGQLIEEPDWWAPTEPDDDEDDHQQPTAPTEPTTPAEPTEPGNSPEESSGTRIPDFLDWAAGHW